MPLGGNPGGSLGKWTAPKLSNLVDDTSPQLGGTLDIQGNTIAGNGGTAGITISANGEVSMTSQPAILAFNSAQDNNVTGDGTNFTLIFDTEVFDQNADFDGTSTFTAPVTGRYLVTASCRTNSLAVAVADVAFDCITSNRSYHLMHLSEISTDTNPYNELNLSGSFIVDMDADDTLTTRIRVSGATKVVDISGSPTLMITALGVMMIA